MRDFRYFTVLTLLGALFFAECNQHRNQEQNGSSGSNITVEGVLKGGEGRLVSLDRMGTTVFVPVDSVRCDSDGAFRIDFNSDGVGYYALKYTEHGYVTVIARPGDRIRISGHADTIYPYVVEGSAASDLVRQLAEKHQEVLLELKEISGTDKAIMGDPGYAAKKQQLNHRFDSITGAFNRYSREFILSNPQSPAILIALYNQFGPGLPVFDPLTDLDIYRFVDSALYSRYPENEAVRTLHSELSAALQQIRKNEPADRLEPGEKAPDFVMRTASDTMLALSDLKGRYVLLQIWASWSKPSVQEQPYLDECYQRFAANGLSILQVSVDDREEQWTGAIEGEYDHWHHVSDLRRWESAIVHLYRVNRIPANFLIDPSGTIVEKDIFGDELMQVLNKYLD